MTDPLSTQLPPTGTVPPSKRLKLDSVGDGADLFLQDLPDDLLVTSIDLPALDGPTDLTGIPGLNSQQLPGLNSTPPNSSSLPPSASPMPAGALSQQPPPPTSAPNAANPSSQPPSSSSSSSSSSAALLVNSGGQQLVGNSTTSIAGAPPNTAVVSTSADPTPALPNVSSTSATTPYPPPNVAAPPSANLGMAGALPRIPSSSTSYNTAYMTSSNSQMNPGMQPQQVMNYMGGGGGSLRHPGPSPNMGPITGQMIHSRNMMVGQPGMIQMRQRQMMHPGVHSHSMMAGHHHQQQPSMGIHHHHQMVAMNRGGQQMAPGMNMVGAAGMMQPGMHMQPSNIHMTSYDPRTRMMQTTLVHKPGLQPHRMPGQHHMQQQQHHGMHPGRPQMAGMIGGPPPQHQYVDPSGYMRGGYTMAPGQSTTVLPPHSHPASSQMLSQQQMQASNAVPPPQNMPTQQPPRPPSEGVGQGSPLPGQMSGGPGPQLQVATPPQQQTTPPQQQTTPSQQQTAGVNPQLTQQATPTSRPATPQQQQQQQSLQGHQMSAPPTPGSIQRGSPVAASSPSLQGPSPSPLPPQQMTPHTGPQQQQRLTPPPPQSQQQQQQQQTPQNQNPQTPSQPPPQQSSGQPLPPASMPLSSASNSLGLTSDPLQCLPGGGVRGLGPGMLQSMGSSFRGPGNFNSLGPPGAGLSAGNQPATTDPEKRKLIQQQLVLLLHAHKCQRREREHSIGGGGDYQPCSLPHCQTMKRVLNHMTECQAGRQCTFAHCASSRQIITHWKNCQKPDCSVCLPLKNAALPPADKQSVRPMMPGVNTPPYSQPPGIGSPQMSPSAQPSHPPMAMVPPGPNNTIRPHPPPVMHPPGGGVGRPSLDTLFGGDTGLSDIGGIDMSNQSRVPFPVSIPTIPNQQTQPWHQMVQPELRQHLVKKLVETIFPIQNANALQDQRVSSLIQYAMKVEKAMFETASNREEYYQLLAEKIYRIRKELEERRKMKLEIEKRRMAEGLPPIDGAIPNGGDGVGMVYQGGQKNSPFSSSHSPFQPGHSNSPGAPSGIADGNPASLSSINDFLTSSEDRKEGILPLSSSSSSIATSSASKLLSPSTSFPEGVDIKSEIKSPPPSIHPPWSRPEAPPISQPATPSDQKPIPSVSRVATPRESVLSVKSRTGGDNHPDSVPPSVPPSGPPSSRPATPSKQMDTSSVTTPSKYKVVPDPSLKKVFTRDELREALVPVLDLVYRQDPEAHPFWDPVDPNALGIPDYFDVIKNPMDLRTIRNKLDGGDYNNPWAFCRDMRLMFDNAWLFNKKTSRVYKYCTKLVEVFDDSINPAMMKLGYCCGQRYTFHPQVLYCYGKSLCTIARDGIYYCYQNRYIYCQKCFSELPGDTVVVGDDPTNTSEISKTTFKEKKNNHVDYEPIVKCIHCGREFHSICVLYHPGIWAEGYQCDSCLKMKGTSRRENKFCAKRLPTNKLSSFLEDRVNMFLRTMDSGSEVIIRTVSSFDKTLDTRPLMKDRFQGDFPEQFPYRTKAMFVFEEIDGSEVCFFGLHVQEYGSDCQAPNTRRVYISYLDSIHFFHPKHLRTLVYHEILIGYLQFCKNNGFMTAHIWACPPSEGDDYIFHCHPPEQKIPKPKRLVEWYKKMLDRGKSDNVVYDYRDIFKHCTEDVVTSVTEIPYFEGDFWPNIIEDTIKELDQEAREREASEAATVEGRGSKKAGKRGTSKKGSKKAGGARSKSGKASGMMIRGDDLSQKIYTTMDKHKEVFFVVLLQPPSVCNSPISSTVDPDPLIPCDLMDGRDAFLTMARERHWEFSSLRRAKTSSQAMLYELHNQGANFIYSCNCCGRSVETRYHCRECEDFDLCLVCYETTKHEHPMEKLGLGMIDPEDQDNALKQDPQARKNASIQKMVEFLIHASQCRNPQCKIPNCIKIKRVLRHTKDCRLRATGRDCQICRHFLFLVYSHAKNCTETNCPVGMICKRVKQNIQDTRAQTRRRNNLLMQQRIRSMQVMVGSSNGNSSSNPAGSPAPPSSSSNTSPPTSKAPPPTPPQKGSPAMASPAGPRSVGKGGPRTPVGEIPGGKGKMVGTPSVASKPDRPMPAPNVTVNQVSMGGEAIIQRIPQPSIMMPGPGQKEHELANIIMGGSPVERERVKQMLHQDHDLYHAVLSLCQQKQKQQQQQQQQMEMSGGGGGGGGGLQGDMAPHQPPSGVPFTTQRQAPMMNARPSQPYSQPHPQLMRAMAPTHYTPQIGGGFRTASYPQSVHHHMVGHGQVYSQQSPQLHRMLSQRTQVQTYQTPPNAYPQMSPHQQPQPVGPPPQYMPRVPPQPQTAVYPHMLAHHHPRQMAPHNPMSQTVGPPMPTGHAHQFGNTAQPMTMDHVMSGGASGDPNFVYNGNQQQTYPLNSNNSNNLSQATYLTPADKLSTLTDLL